MTSRRLLDPVSRILLQAADYMEEHGHCKHILQNDRGAVCINGALQAVLRQQSVSKAIYCYDVHMASNRIIQHIHADPVQWNNAPERKKEEVVAALRGAAFMEVVENK